MAHAVEHNHIFALGPPPKAGFLNASLGTRLTSLEPPAGVESIEVEEIVWEPSSLTQQQSELVVNLLRQPRINLPEPPLQVP
jgi:hypothetical protein